jgi:hypothetical protein
MFTLSDPTVRTYWIALTAGAITGLGYTDPGQLLMSPADSVLTYTDEAEWEAAKVAHGYVEPEHPPHDDAAPTPSV